MKRISLWAFCLFCAIVSISSQGCKGASPAFAFAPEVERHINECIIGDPRVRAILASKPSIFSRRQGCFGIIAWRDQTEVRIGKHSTTYRNGALARAVRLGRVKGVPEAALEPTVEVVDGSSFSRRDVEIIGSLVRDKCREYGNSKPVVVLQVIRGSWQETWRSH